MTGPDRATMKRLVAEHVPSIEPCNDAMAALFAALRGTGQCRSPTSDIRRIWRQAYDATRKETHPGMEGFKIQPNPMHSRAAIRWSSAR